MTFKVYTSVFTLDSSYLGNTYTSISVLLSFNSLHVIVDTFQSAVHVFGWKYYLESLLQNYSLVLLIYKQLNKDLM
jgi:hypothetical protein